MTTQEYYQRLKQTLVDAGYLEYDVLARRIICHFEQWTTSQFILNQATQLSSFEVINQTVKLMVEKKIPWQYIVREADFFKHQFYVDERVLIPRKETEQLVELVCQDIPLTADPTIFEIGVGSGAICISIKDIRHWTSVYGSDISKAALEVCALNCERLKHPEIQLLHGDGCQPFQQLGIKCDILVANPPYIDSNEVLASQVANHEPHQALYAPNHGLAVYEHIFQTYETICKPHAKIYLEFGYQQRDVIEALIQRYIPHSTYQFYRDYNHQWRNVVIHT